MLKLSIPLEHVSQKTIYSECADNFNDKTALRYLKKAMEAAKAYKMYVPKDIEHFPEYKIKKGDDKEIVKVYTEKFARKNSVGRKYYNAIIANANGRCPICGAGPLEELDHYLPKSEYPLLCVTPANLIPECSSCNGHKKARFSKDYYSLAFNPYFDDMSDKWLECSVEFNSDSTYSVFFYNGYDKTKNALMWEKYEAHLDIHNLNSTFSSQALIDIDSCYIQYQKQLWACGEKSVELSLIDVRDSCEYWDTNSWKAALYRELVKKVHSYCLWLDKMPSIGTSE